MANSGNSDKPNMKDGTGMRHMPPEDVEINVMYLMSYSLWFLANDAQIRMEARNQSLHHKQKQAFNNMISALKRVKATHDIMFEDYVTAWGNKVENYVGEQFNANLITRLLLLFYDRVLCNADRENAVFKLLRSFPEEDITEKVLEAFYMKK